MWTFSLSNYVLHLLYLESQDITEVATLWRLDLDAIKCIFCCTKVSMILILRLTRVGGTMAYKCIPYLTDNKNIHVRPTHMVALTRVHDTWRLKRRQ